MKLKKCPFCAGKVKAHPSGRKDYKVCYHLPDCFILNKADLRSKKTESDFTLIPYTKRYIKAWNTRYISEKSNKQDNIAAHLTEMFRNGGTVQDMMNYLNTCRRDKI